MLLKPTFGEVRLFGERLGEHPRRLLPRVGALIDMKNPVLFYGAIVVAVVALALAIYYIIPGIYHPLTTTPPLASHPTHAVAFFILAALSVVAALVTRPKSARR